jgi:hypothetical protein
MELERRGLNEERESNERKILIFINGNSRNERIIL